MLVNIEAPIGDITLDGLGGLLNIRGSNGNVNVNHAILLDGSHIETGQGNVTFNGLLVVPTDGQTPARYMISSEQGMIDVTLPGNTNVILDTNTNVGNIHSEFNAPIQGGGSNGVNYYGPLDTTTAATTTPTAVLSIDVSSGNVNIHKAQG